MSRLKLPARIRNYTFAQQRQKEVFQLPWVRPEDLSGKELPKPVVVINGVFDLLHSSHMRLIFAAREKAGTLICAMDSDRLVKKHKGQYRPIMSWPERYAAMSYMPVDYIVEIDDDRDFQRLMATVKPDIRFQGVDHAGQFSRASGIPKVFIREGKIRTSEIIRRCAESVAKEAGDENREAGD
jgi:cytidyltransferase-like protein